MLSLIDLEQDRDHSVAKIITLWQPWATLISLKVKNYETRGWSTSYQGELVIHAANLVKKCLMIQCSFQSTPKIKRKNRKHLTRKTARI
jgi:hypothetical protein